MGKSKTTTSTTQKATPTAEETQLNQLRLRQAQATEEGQTQVQQQGLDLISQLLSGQNLPGFLEGLPGGISDDIASSIASNAVNDIRPGFQASGILDSGVAADISARTAGDVRRSVGEFNIGNLLNLLNLAVGGQAQVQQPILQNQGQLGSSLAGLRTIQGSSSTTSPNPFLTSFQQSAGRTLGSPFGSFSPKGFTGGFGGGA